MNFKNNELLMLGIAFILGVFVDRYMNHRDVVTGEVKEGNNIDLDDFGSAIVMVIIVVLVVLLLVVIVMTMHIKKNKSNNILPTEFELQELIDPTK